MKAHVRVEAACAHLVLGHGHDAWLERTADGSSSHSKTGVVLEDRHLTDTPRVAERGTPCRMVSVCPAFPCDGWVGHASL